MMPTRPVDYPANRLSFALGVVKEHAPRHLRRAALNGALRASRMVLTGDQVECPACGATASQYFRGRCSSCSAAARQRLIALFLQRELGIADAAGARVLHFAPEPGLIRMLSKLPRVEYVPADLVPDKGHERVDATDIHLAPTFDGVITSHVLEHIPDDCKAIAEMHRILQPGGWAVVVVPVLDTLEDTFEDESIRSRWARHRYYGQHDHVRLYGRDFIDRLRRAGFTVDERRYADELSPEDARRYGVRSADVIFLCRKAES